jgi:tetratricopeptide (TPR) repeat protein
MSANATHRRSSVAARPCAPRDADRWLDLEVARRRRDLLPGARLRRTRYGPHMPDPVFERYKETLRAGHVSMLRGRLREALDHYKEAAALADHRALPHASVGTVLLQLGRPQEALAAYDRALEREPTNEAARSGRADALDALGRFDEAATVRRAIQDLGFETAEALAVVGPGLVEETIGAPRPAEGERLLQGARMAAARGDTEDELAGYVQAAAAYSRAERSDAAIDACLRALSIAPGDPHVHLTLARLYFERGWRERAVEKLVLLERLVDVAPHEEARIQLLALVSDRAPDDPRLAHVMGRSDEGTAS